MSELVSIITACYNAEKYIGQTIESVLIQTYRNWEMIIVDDCSTDNSREIVKSYIERDARIKLFQTEKPSGSPAEPRNIGIRNARGRYVAFLDSDDLWLHEKLERQIRLFEDKNVALVYSNYEKISEEGTRNNRVITAPKRLTYKKLLKSNYIGCLTAIYDTSKTGKLYFRNLRHEDYVLWLDILRTGNIAVNTSMTDALYRVRDNSLTSKKHTVLKWQWDIYRDYLNLSFFRSIYYFCFYMVNACLKYIK